MSRRRRRRRNSNPNAGASLALSAASLTLPLLPWILVAGGAYYLWKRFLASPVSQGAQDVSNAAKGIASGVAIASDPSQWKPAYQAAEAAWQAAGGEGSPVAQPYYGPAGESGDMAGLPGHPRFCGCALCRDAVGGLFEEERNAATKAKRKEAADRRVSSLQASLAAEEAFWAAKGWKGNRRPA